MRQKVKLFMDLIKYYTMKTYSGVEVIDSSWISALDRDEWPGARPGRFKPWGKKLQYPLDTRLGESQNLSGRYGEEKNFLPLPGIEPRPLGRPSRTLAAIPT
jgi:hypothetical protein